MNALNLPFALFAFFGFVAVVPPWMYFVGEYGDGLPAEARFLAQLVLPATVALFIVSWINPG